MNENTTNTATVEDAGRWLDGAPLPIPSEIVHIDLMIYRKMVCPICRKRGMKTTPQHTASGAYRVLCSCRNCRHVEAC